MTLRRPELVTPETIEKDYKNYKIRLSFEVVAIQFLLTEAKEYGAQPETLALLEKSIENFKRINEIEFSVKAGN